MKYSSKDIELVVNKYYEIKRLPVTSEFLRGKIIGFANNKKSKNEYKSKYPYTAIWKINSDCNLRCKHCYFYGNNNYSTDNDLSFTKICQVINQLSDLGIAEIRLTGGEIFLQKDILKIIKYIKSKGISVIITTNGTLINEEIAQKLNEIISPSADIVRISIDGGSRATHDSTRGTGVYDKAIRSIKLLREKGLTVFCSTVITSNNIQELPELYNLLNNLEVKQMTLIKIVPIDNSQQKLVPTFDNMVYYSAKMYNSIKENDFIRIDNRLFKPFDFLQDETSKKYLNKLVIKHKDFDLSLCHCNTDKSFYIDADGTIYLCPLAADYNYAPLGNIRNEDLETIFEKRSENILFKHRDLSDSLCSSCKILPLCKGNCLMQSYMKHGSIDIPPCC